MIREIFSFMAGLYGMNVPLPGQAWQPGFWLLLSGMGAVGAGLLLFFRKRRWV